MSANCRLATRLINILKLCCFLNWIRFSKSWLVVHISACQSFHFSHLSLQNSQIAHFFSHYSLAERKSHSMAPAFKKKKKSLIEDINIIALDLEYIMRFNP